MLIILSATGKAMCRSCQCPMLLDSPQLNQMSCPGCLRICAIEGEFKGASHGSRMATGDYPLERKDDFKLPCVTLPAGVSPDDAVQHPSHYTQGKIECIDAIESALSPEEFAGFCKGSSIQYEWRAKHKGNPKQDIEKSIWYLNRYLRSL